MADARETTERAGVIIGIGDVGSGQKPSEAQSLVVMAHHVHVIKTVDTDVRPRWVACVYDGQSPGLTKCPVASRFAALTLAGSFEAG